MALKTSLVITGDAASAEAALKATDHALAATETEAKALAAAFGAADISISKLAATQAAAKLENAASKKAFDAGSISLEEYQRELLETKTALSLVEAEHRKSVTSLKKAQGAYDDAVNSAGDLQKASAKVTTAQGALGNSAKLSSNHLSNLAFQANDVAVSLASGQAPMMVLIQQGSQIAQIMGQAGVGVGGLVKQLGGMAVGWLAANPLMAAGAVAAGLVAGAIGLITSEINENSAVQVTWQDTALGAFDAVKEAVTGGLVAAFEYFGISTDDVWAKVVSGVKTAMNIVIGVATAVPRFLIASWDVLPGALGDVAYSAANAVIRGLNSLVEKGVNLLNGFILSANGILSKVGLELPTLKAPQIGELVNSYTGAAAKAGTAYAKVFSDTVSRDFIGEAAEYLSPYAQDRARKRMEEDAKKAGKKAGGAAGKEIGKAATAEAAKAMSFDEAFAPLKEYMGKVDAILKENLDLGETIEKLEREAQVIGLVGSARENMLAQLEYEAQARDLVVQITAAELAGQDSLAQALRRTLELRQAELVLKVGNNAGEDRARDAAAALNVELDHQATMLDIIHDRASGVADTLAGAFGRAGEAVGGLLTAYTVFAAEQEHLDRERAERLKDVGDNAAAAGKIEIEYAAKSKNAQLGQYGAVLGAAKGFFKEHSTGYKLITAAEQVFAALKLANTIQAIAMDATQTASSVANSTTRAAADQAAGASKIFSQLGVFAFPVVAAMIAVLASLGVKGGGGGSSAAPPPTPEELQARIGTGTVLGDSNAQSESLNHAIEVLASNSNEDLEYSNQMVGYLRSISEGIGDLTGQIARQIGLGATGMFSTDQFKLGTTGKSGFLGLFGGSSTTTSLYDQGLEVFAQTVDQVLAGQFNAQVYNVIQTVKTKKGFLGIGGGTKTSYSTSTGGVDQAILAQFGLIVKDISASVGAFASQLGIEIAGGIDGLLSQTALPAIKLSFAGMSGDEIQSALEAYFSSVADVLAGVLDEPLGLGDLQQAGEGLYETLARVTRTIMTVDSSLKAANLTPLSQLSGGNAAASARISDDLVGQFGGLDAFQEAVAKYAETFLTEAERMQPVIDAVRAEMARLGQAGVTTNDQFKALVQGLDLGTASGQAMFAQLMAVAPAFAKVTEYLGSLTGELGENAEVLKERRALEIRLLELQGQAEAAIAAKRADQLAALDPSNRALLEQVFALEDQQAALATATRVAEDAARAEAQLADQRATLQIRSLRLLGDEEGALAIERQRQIDALPEVLRGELARIFQLEDARAAQDAAARAAEQLAQAQVEAARAAEAAAEAELALARRRQGLEAQVLELQGDAAGALAIQRQLELDAMDASLRPLQEMIYGLTDAKAAAEMLAKAQEDAARSAAETAQAEASLARTRRSLEAQILELQGDAIGAVAIQRQLELDAMDASLRPLQEMIYQLIDARAAAEDLSRAQEDAAQSAREAAQAASDLARTRRSMEAQILELQGDAAGALAITRSLELEAMDESLRPMQEMIYQLTDARAAAEEAARAQEAANRASEQAAASAEALARQRAALEVRMLEAQGRSVEALALSRAQELAGMDASLRSLMQQVWVLEDAKKAEDARTAAIAKARTDLTTAYQREAGALGETIRKFGEFGQSLRAFRAGLFSAAGGGAAAYALAKSRFDATAALAASGDQKGLSELETAAKALLDAGRASAGSLQAYQRDVAAVARAVDLGVAASDEAGDYAQLQLDALDRSVEGLIDIDASVVSVREAIETLQDLIAQGASVPAGGASLPPAVQSSSSGGSDSGEALRTEMAGLRSDLNLFIGAGTRDLGQLRRILERFDDTDGLLVKLVPEA